MTDTPPTADRTYFDRLMLAWLIRDREAQVKAFAIYTPESFSGPTYRALFRMIRNLDRPLDPGIFKAELRAKERMLGDRMCRRLKILFKSLHTYKTKNLPAQDYVFDEFDTRLNADRTVDAITKYAAMFEKGEFHQAEEFMVAEMDRLRLSNRRMVVDAGKIGEDFAERWREVAARGSGKVPLGVATGFPTLDEASVGGLWPGEMGIIFALTGVGKSTMALNMAHHAMTNGKKVIYVTTEMPKLQVQFRYDAMLTGIPYSDFKMGRISVEQRKQWREMLRKQDEKGGWIEVVSVPLGCTLPFLQSIIEKARRLTGVDLLILDYMDMMEMPEAEKWRNEQYVLGVLSAGLKHMAMLYKLPVWSLTQARGDSAEKDALDAQDVGYSRKKLHYADVGIGINQTEHDRQDGYLSVHMVKMRDGGSGNVFKVRPDFEIMRMEEARD